MVIFIYFFKQSFASIVGQDYDNPKVKPSASANAIYSLTCRYITCLLCLEKVTQSVKILLTTTHKLSQIWINIKWNEFILTVNIPILVVCRTPQALRGVTGEEARDSEEESEYMIPSSRPVLPPITTPSVETTPIPRPPQPQPPPALQTQSQTLTLNSRCSRIILIINCKINKYTILWFDYLRYSLNKWLKMTVGFRHQLGWEKIRC